MKKAALIAALLPFAFGLLAQNNLPIIKANSRSVAIRDGDEFSKNGWSLSPDARPDVYEANRTRKTKTVTFYTDLDSISFRVKPFQKHDFIILLHGKDSCYTQIASAIQYKSLRKNNPHAKPDTIPFTLTPFNNLAVNVLVNQQDTLIFMFHTALTGADITEAGLKKSHLKVDGNSVVQSWGGSAQSGFSAFNSLQVGTQKWDSLTISVDTYSGQGTDGKFGYDFFQDKVLEINYDQNRLIVRPELPKNLKGYAKLPIEYKRGSFYINASMNIAGRTFTAPFMVHSGYSGALILSDEFIEKNNLGGKFDTLGIKSLKDAYGNTINNITTRIPELKIGKTVFHDLLIGLMAKGTSRIPANIVGGDLLKRFNIVLDFPNDFIYLKPNSLFNTPFKSL